MPPSSRTMKAMITMNAVFDCSPGTWTFMPQIEATSVRRQDDHRDRGQHPEGLVGAMRDRRLVGRLEALDDLLVVLEHVPDALGRVVDVVEVDVEVLGDVARLGALEVAERRPLRPDDLAEVDDLLLDVGDVAHDLEEFSPSKISSSMRSSLLPILRSIGNEASTESSTIR